MVTFSGALLAAGIALAEQPAAPNAAEVARQIPALIEALDSPRFDARARASRQLAAFAEHDELRPLLAERLTAALLSTELSFEARSRLAPLLKRLPAPDKPAALEAAPARIERLIDALEDDSAGVRAGAQAQLELLAKRPSSNPDVMAALKRRLASAELEPSSRTKLRELLDQARGVWLLSDPSTWRPIEVSDEQIAGWIDELARPAADAKAAIVQEAAQRELLDLLARDQYVPRVREALEKRLADKRLDIDAVKRLEAVYDWTRPAMVAEYWQGAETRAGVQHLGIQYVLIDVPSVPEGGIRATHFDRIDDRIAHCVSGNSLSPGDYPVDVFFPHPQQGGAQFHLINLPTPRRRLAYEYEARIDDLVRSRQITRRTLDRILAERKPLSQAEILMLEELDDGQVSAFAGEYLMKVDDSYYPPAEAQFVGNLSRHLNFCCMLARSGRHEAIDGLMRAIKARRFLEPPAETPYDWPWVAALCIAVHDPWSGVDEFLAGLVEKEQPLMRAARSPQTGPQPMGENSPTDSVPEPKVPDLGATAATVLLSRHGIPPSIFGLEVLMYSPLISLDCPGAYFREGHDRQRVLQWWSKQKAHDAARG
jgi:hypothetical protein